MDVQDIKQPYIENVGYSSFVFLGCGWVCNGHGNLKNKQNKRRGKRCNLSRYRSENVGRLEIEGQTGGHGCKGGPAAWVCE